MVRSQSLSNNDLITLPTFDNSITNRCARCSVQRLLYLFNFKELLFFNVVKHDSNTNPRFIKIWVIMNLNYNLTVKCRTENRV